MKNKVAIIYSRVSTVMQEDKDSLAVQVQKCEEYCKLNNYQVLDVVTDVESGAKDEREGFQRVLSLVKNRSFDVLVVYETSRVSRKTKTLVNLIHDLMEHEVAFVSISQKDINTETAGGMMLFEMMASMAAYERRLISEREKSSKSVRARNGQWLGGSKPIGYDIINKQLVINEAEAVTVRGMFNMYLEESSFSKVAKHYGKPLESLKWILSNPLYIGKRRWGMKEKNIHTGKQKVNAIYDVYDSHQEAIVSDELFERVNSLILSNRNSKPVSKSNLIFPGLIICPKCGKKKMYAITMRSINHYYKCDNKADKCSFLLKKNDIEELLIENIINSQHLDKLNGIQQDCIPLSEQGKELVKRVELSKDEVKKLTKSFIKGLIPEDIFSELKNEIDFGVEGMKNEIRDIENRIKKIKSSSINLEHHKSLIKAIENMSDEDIPQMKKIMKLMINKIQILDVEKKEFKVHYNF